MGTVIDPKEFAITHIGSALTLDMADLKQSLPDGMSLVTWKPFHPNNGIRARVHIRTNGLRGFYTWAVDGWAWSGAYEIHLIIRISDYGTTEDNLVVMKTAGMPLRLGIPGLIPEPV